MKSGTYTNGHLIPESLGGPFTLDNVVLQQHDVNTLINTKLEQAIWHPALRSDRTVDVRIQIIYNPNTDTMRPDRFRIDTLIDNHQHSSYEINNDRNAKLIKLR